MYDLAVFLAIGFLTVGVVCYFLRIRQLEKAIRKHRDQKADDRCWMDDQELYSVLGDADLGDNHVGDPGAMLKNCERYIERRCRGGKWPSYADLENHIAAQAIAISSLQDKLALFDPKFMIGSGRPFNELAPKEVEELKEFLAGFMRQVIPAQTGFFMILAPIGSAHYLTLTNISPSQREEFLMYAASQAAEDKPWRNQ